MDAGDRFGFVDRKYLSPGAHAYFGEVSRPLLSRKMTLHFKHHPTREDEPLKPLNLSRFLYAHEPDPCTLWECLEGFDEEWPSYRILHKSRVWYLGDRLLSASDIVFPEGKDGDVTINTL